MIQNFKSNQKTFNQSSTQNQIQILYRIKHSESNSDIISNQALRIKFKDYIIVDKNQEEKTYKKIKKGFQSLKTDQQQVLY
jgi:hypothetical protein